LVDERGRRGKRKDLGIEIKNRIPLEEGQQGVYGVLSFRAEEKARKVTRIFVRGSLGLIIAMVRGESGSRT